MPLDHAHCMRIALDEARRGKAEGNVAVGSIIVQGDTVLTRRWNLVTSTNDPTAYAETVALREAGAAIQCDNRALGRAQGTPRVVAWPMHGHPLADSSLRGAVTACCEHTAHDAGAAPWAENRPALR